MNIFGVLNSLANGTVVEDAIDGLEKGLEQLENLVGEGESKLNAVVDTADTTLQHVIDGADKAANVADVVQKKLGE